MIAIENNSIHEETDKANLNLKWGKSKITILARMLIQKFNKSLLEMG